MKLGQVFEQGEVLTFRQVGALVELINPSYVVSEIEIDPSNGHSSFRYHNSPWDFFNRPHDLVLLGEPSKGAVKLRRFFDERSCFESYEVVRCYDESFFID